MYVLLALWASYQISDPPKQFFFKFHTHKQYIYNNINAFPVALWLYDNVWNSADSYTTNRFVTNDSIIIVTQENRNHQ